MGGERTGSRSRRRENRVKENPVGCMSGFLQLFDLHQRLFRATAAATQADAFPPVISEETSPPGMMAPRNSLKLEEETVSSSSTVGGEEEEEEDYDIPMSISLVLDKKNTPRQQELDLESSRSSPMAALSKNGNVVARLMGLDQISDQTPSRSSDGYSSQDQLSSLRIAASRKLLKETAMTPPPLRQRNCNALPAPEDAARHGTRSLPDTPRASSARKSADSDPRLSLQLSFKENFLLREDAALLSSPSIRFAKSRRRISSLQIDENRSPRQYASDIMKQVKESVTRRIARRRFEDRPQGASTEKEEAMSSDAAKSLRSPRLSSLDLPKNKPEKLVPNHSRKLISPPSPPAAKADSGKSKKARSERFMEKIKKLPPVRAPPPSSPQPKPRTFVPAIRKEASTTTSPVPSPAPQQRTAASSQQPISNDGATRDSRSSNAAVGPEEYLYIKCVLERTGVKSTTAQSLAAVKWYSPSHPLDPLVFHQLERSFRRSSGPLHHRCNRKLLFNLVDEQLADILWPFLHSAPWEEQWRHRMVILGGESIMQSLWRRIRSSTGGASADMQSLVAADLAASHVRRLPQHPAMAKEAELVAAELGSFILDSLIAEAVAALMTSCAAAPPLVQASWTMR